MDTLEELINYCKANRTCSPAGALMLTGEWGSGKTYLIEKSFGPALRDEEFALVRISLMGKTSIEEIRSAVCSEWIQSLIAAKQGKSSSELPFKEMAKGLTKIASLFAPDKIKELFSPSLVGMLPIRKEYDGIVSVLVFDDLERSELNIIDLLGCINDYCENQHFPTIIIANESRLSSRLPSEKDSGNLALNYNTIKEKIVQQTIYFKPNYGMIIECFITEIKARNKDYGDFLYAYRADITDLFCGDEMRRERARKEKHSEFDSHNLRSLKCSLQNFDRVFTVLKELSVSTEFQRACLLSFIAYTLAFKALCSRSEDLSVRGFDFETLVARIYVPYFDQYAFFPSIEKWICTGIWDEREFKNEAERNEIIQETDPEHQIENTYLDHLDEELIEDYFPKFIERAYAGSLKLSAYSVLLADLSHARRMKYELLPRIDYDLLRKGIEIALRNSNDDLKNYSDAFALPIDLDPEERVLYSIIQSRVKKDILLFQKSHKTYLELMKADGVQAINNRLRSMKYDVFDEEMAKATASYFQRCSNKERIVFINCFTELWQSNFLIEPNKYEICTTALQILKKELEQYLTILNHNRAVTRYHTQRLINEVSSTIQTLGRA